MGDGSGTASTATGRARALWMTVWRHRTKITGYLGISAAAVQTALLQGQRWQLALLGAAVAAIGHYNDHAQGT